MIKKSFRLMLLVAFALSSVMFVACNKYDDDIERIDNELAALNATVSSLKAAVDGGAVISSVSNTTEGVKFTLSNGQSYTVNHGAVGATGATGATGAAGQDGKPGSVVTIGENGNWFIDGVDQNVSAVGASTFVVDCGSYYELNVVEKVDGENSEIVKINLPKTADITSIKTYSINNAGAMSEAVVVLNYGEKHSDEISFNDKTYAAGTNLIAAGSSLSAVVNPVSADASLYSFSLVDSKGNAPYVISNVTENKTEGALTKAATVNNGVWNMNVTFSDELLFSDEYDLYDYAAARSKAAYALTTVTSNGTVASAYDVTVNENMIPLGSLDFTPADLVGNVNKAIDLTKTFGDDLKYVVDYYFTFADQTAASKLGAKLNGNTITATKSGDVKVLVYYLLVDGTCIEEDPEDITVKFDHVAADATLGEITWTINNSSYASQKRVYLKLTDEIKNMLVANADNQYPTVEIEKWTWADGTELDEKTVVVNGVKYGKAGDVKFSGNEKTWITSLQGASNDIPHFYRNTSGYAPRNIREINYLRFGFSTADAFPGEYIVTLAFTKYDDDDVTVKVPVKVTIKEPTSVPFQRLDAFFDGDNAVAYGIPSTPKGNVTYSLFSLYEEMSETEMSNVTWSETKHSSSVHSGCAAWLTTNGNISVAASPYNSGSDNRDGVYTTRTIKASYKVFGNEHIAKVNDEFSLTIKSEIAEGKLDASSANVEITNAIDAVAVSLKNIKATDVYGRAYNLANIYSKDEDGNYTVNAGSRDDRISSVSFYTEDKQYITVDETLTNAKDGFSAFTVKRTGNTVLTKDVTCTVYVEVVDNWGRYTETSFTVTLKK